MVSSKINVRKIVSFFLVICMLNVLIPIQGFNLTKVYAGDALIGGYPTSLEEYPTKSTLIPSSPSDIQVYAALSSNKDYGWFKFTPSAVGNCTVTLDSPSEKTFCWYLIDGTGAMISSIGNTDPNPENSDGHAEDVTSMNFTFLAQNKEYYIEVYNSNADFIAPIYISGLSTGADTTKPLLSNVGTSVETPNTLAATSNENGTIYLVLKTADITDKTNLEAEVSGGRGTKVTVTANNPAAVPTTDLIAGTYVVYAVDGAGNMSAKSADVTVTNPDTTKPLLSNVGTSVETPNILAATSNENGTIYLVLKTAGITDKTNLEAEVSGGRGTKVTVTANNPAAVPTTDLIAGTYVVYAVDGAGNMSAKSADVTVTNPDTTKPLLSNVGTSVETPNTLAATSNENGTIYLVLKTAGITDKTNLEAEVSGGRGTKVTVTANNPVAVPTTDLIAGTYVVYAVDGAGNMSAKSADVTVTNPDTTKPLLSNVGTSVETPNTLAATSNENGTIYLVLKTADITDKTNLEAEVSGGRGTKVTVTANNPAAVPTTDLIAGTYVVYAVDGAGNMSAKSADVTVTNPDTTKPLLSNVGTSVETPNILAATSNENGTIYLVLKTAGITDKTNLEAEVSGGRGTKVTVTANNPVAVPTTDLIAGTYVVYAVDGAGNMSAKSADVTVTNPDTTAPEWITSYPKQGTVNASSVQILGKINEAGKAYWVCVPSSSSAPTADKVKAGQNGAGSPVGTGMSGNIDLTANSEGNFTVSSLSASTGYDIYVVAEDGVPNLQATVAKVSVTTSELSPIEITTFDPIPDKPAGNAGSATYASAADVIAALPTSVTANSNAVTVSVITWLDTDNYNPNRAGRYTFTATLDAIPPGYANSLSRTATVEVVVEAPTPPTPTPEPQPTTEKITVDVTDGSSDNTVSKTEVQRTTNTDGTKKDDVQYTSDKAKETVDALKNEGKDTARIVVPDVKDEVSEANVAVPKSTIEVLASGSINLEIDTENARITVPKESVKDVAADATDDLYFRLVPIKEATQQAVVEQRAKQEEIVQQVAGNSDISVVGRPMTIETNMKQTTTDITLPLKNVNIPTDPAEKQAFLNSLAVFIEHTDGTKELLKGKIVEYKSGVLGIEFTIHKYSTFTIIKMDIKNSTISPTAAEFDKNTSKQADVNTTMTLNGNTLSSIVNGSKTLVNGTDYEIKDNVATIKKNYLASQSVGTTALTFNFNTGNTQALVIAVKDTIIQNSTINPITAEFDKNTSKQADVNTTMTLNANTLSSIVNGSKTLVNGTDYEVKDNVATIKKNYLASQSVGTTTLTFNFNTGNIQSLLITVKDTTTSSSGGSSGGSGGSSSSGGSAPVPAKASVERIYGQDRVNTAIAIAKATYKDKVSKVILAASDNYPDALAGSVLAYKEKAPILLVGKNAEDQEKVIAYMKENMDSAGSVYILGGTSSVSNEMEEKVNTAGFRNISRIGGADRYETAVKIADTIGVKEGTPVIIVSGDNYPDAISVSSTAAANGYPIFMVSKDEIPDVVKKEISAIKPSKVYIIGLQGAVGTGVEQQLTKASVDKTNIVRIGGQDRYETSLNVAKYFNTSVEKVSVASGENFPDALAGSSYAANNKSPIILIGNSLTEDQKTYLKNAKLNSITIFGGTGAVTTEIENVINELIKK